jgi:hypothetical protein
MVEGAGNHKEYSLEAAAVILFGPLREAERRLLLALPLGERVFVGPEGADLAAPENDPEHADQWGEEREVRVALLRWLCIDPSARAVISPEGVRLAGARFDDRLVLSFATVPFPLRLAACYFPKGIAIEGASLPLLTLMRCWIGPLPSAAAVETAVIASNLKVAGSVSLDHTHTIGELQLFGAEIGKTLNCEGASLTNAGGIALNCERAKIGGVALLRNGFTSEGEVRFIAAAVGGLDCDGSSFKNGSRRALDCALAKIGGTVFLRNQFTSEGELHFWDTQIAGDLNCTGASLKNAGGATLQCTGSKIGGSVFLHSNFSSEGTVNLVRCQIGGNLECDHASLKNASGRALNCSLANIRGVAILQNGFTSEGEVQFVAATVGGLECNDASFKKASGPALNCEAAKIGGLLLLRKPIAAQGEVRLYGAQIGHLYIEEIDLSVGAGGSLVARLAEIKGEFSIQALTCGPNTIVDLRGASCDLFADDPRACPEQGNLRLDGFVYRRLTNPGAAKARLRWVRSPLPANVANRRGVFRPQPYRLLARPCGLRVTRTTPVGFSFEWPKIAGSMHS